MPLLVLFSSLLQPHPNFPIPIYPTPFLHPFFLPPPCFHHSHYFVAKEKALFECTVIYNQANFNGPYCNTAILNMENKKNTKKSLCIVIESCCVTIQSTYLSC